MIRIRPRLSRSAVIAALTLSTVAHSAPAPDDEARFLAGLPPRDNSPLEGLTHSRAWAAHAAELDRAWNHLNLRQLQPIATWAPEALGHFYTERAPLLYFFSGPDFLYAHAFFPSASTYVLCGIEPIGPLPRIEELPPQTLAGSLATIRESMGSLLDFSFFITKKMRVQLNDSRIAGTLPLLYIFLARSGCHIREVAYIGLDGKGQLTSGRTLAPGVKIVFSGSGGTDQVLYYFSTDLSDGSVERSGILKWCADLGPGAGFLKAASYLMHTGGFEDTRKFLLAECPAILEDDSGIPARFFTPQDWDIHLFGNYQGPIATFKQFPQPDLNEIKGVQKPAPLPFSVGYRWHPGESSLIFAVKAGHAG